MNEGFARAAAAAFAAQLDPTLDELGRHQDGGHEAVTNCIVHAYPDSLGRITMRLRILDGDTLEISVKDAGVGITRRREGARAALHHRRRGAQRHGLYIMESFTDRLGRPLPSRPRHDRDHAPQDSATGQMTAGAASLLRAARDGDREAAERLVRENSGLILERGAALFRQGSGRGGSLPARLRWAF